MPRLDEDGTYLGEITDIYPALIGANKTPAVKIHVKITEDGGHYGQHVNGVLWFSPKARKRSMETLVKFGVVENDFDTLDNAMNAKVEVACEWDEAREYVNVQWFNLPGESGGQQHGKVGLDVFKAALGEPPEAEDNLDMGDANDGSDPDIDF